MKIALLGDLHMGVKKDNPWMQKNIEDFIIWFTDYCKANGIKICIQAGDWFDVRQGLSQTTLNFVRTVVAPRFQDTFDTTVVDVGNHDLKLKEFITPNSCTEALAHLDKFTVIEKPTTMNFDGFHVDIIPWICKSNEEEINQFIRKTASAYCVGHFELTGFEYYKGLKSSGIEPDFLEKYSHVWSGHFHTISRGGNVTYLGTPYTVTMGDANDARGFWVYDTVSAEISFIENPITNHYRVYFDADTWEQSAKDIKEKYENKCVKLVIEKSHSETKKVNVDKVLDQFEAVCYEFDHEFVVSNIAGDSEDEQQSAKVKSTTEIIIEKVDALDESSEVIERVKKIMNGLYAEALHL